MWLQEENNQIVYFGFASFSEKYILSRTIVNRRGKVRGKKGSKRLSCITGSVVQLFFPFSLPHP
jgi:hypothetical protein